MMTSDHNNEQQLSDHVIIESNDFIDGIRLIKEKIKQGLSVLAAADLDNTVISYSHTLGTDQWFDFDFKEFMQNGLSAMEAKNQTLPAYLQIVKRIHRDDVYVVEKETPKGLRELQDLGVDVIALTSRGGYLLADTLEQLNTFGVDFNKGHYANKQQKISLDDDAEYYNGMILCAGQHKGKCLFECLDPKHLPDCIVMWDDKRSNLDKVSDTIKAFNNAERLKNPLFKPIEFIGIRYGRLDHLIQQVDPEIVALQRQYFERILSDEHARAILKAENKKKQPPQAYIDHDKHLKQVTMSITHSSLYELLKRYFPDIDCYRVLAKEMCVDGKFKLPWQFTIPEDAFYAIFAALSQHGRIRHEQFDSLERFFSAPAINFPKVNTYLPGYQCNGYTLRPHRAIGYDKEGAPKYATRGQSDIDIKRAFTV